MNKVWSFLQKWVLGFVEKPVLQEEGIFLEEALTKFYDKSPAGCKAMVNGLYGFVDTVVEDMAIKTETKYDDDEVAEVKKDLEFFAKEKGFAIANLDAGTVND